MEFKDYPAKQIADKLKQVEEQGGDIRMVAPPPPSMSQPGLVPCRYCDRKFREEAHERHEGICQRVFGGKKGNSKPQPSKNTNTKFGSKPQKKPLGGGGGGISGAKTGANRPKQQRRRPY